MSALPTNMRSWYEEASTGANERRSALNSRIKFAALSVIVLFMAYRAGKRR